MAAFTGEELEELGYDFTKWGGPKGVIPEPSQKAMKKYQQSLSRTQIAVSKAYADLQKAGEDGVDEALVKRLEEAADQADEDLNRELGKLCQDRPSAEDIAKLPFRVKQGFLKWLMKELTPEGGASGTSS